jgi:hypothetical protein
MSTTLTPFNRLPPRGEYIEKVMDCLTQHGKLSCTELMRLTGLSKTQVMCALEAKICDGTVHRILADKYIYQLA